MKLTLIHEKRNGSMRAYTYPYCDRSKLLITLLWDARQQCVRKTFSRKELDVLYKMVLKLRYWEVGS